ncbi:MAG: NifU family protein, partial [Bdellovibrio sp.]|nr:NifU family protein [Bdellovibrio sp.]
MAEEEVYVSLDFTPNPNTLKYNVNRILVSKGAYQFLKKAIAEKKSPLAARLLSVPGVVGVMLGKDFVSVTKSEDGDWGAVHKNCSETIYDHLSKKLLVLDASALQEESHKSGESAIAKRIIEILDTEIRPAVAMDGGDITFDRFEDGIVYLYLQGSCSGCPSS